MIVPILNELSAEQLNFILAAEKLKEVKRAFPEQADELIALANLHANPLKRPRFLLSRSIVATMMEAPSYPLIMLWCLVGVVMGVSAGAIVAVCAVFGVFILGVIGIYSIGTYRELKNENRKTNEAIDLVALQHLCAEALLLQQGITQEALVELKRDFINENPPIIKPDNKKWIRAKNALEITLIVSATLFTAYYITIQSVFVALEYAALAAALAGPIGIGIALTVSFGAALFFSYKQYQLDKGNQIQKKQIKRLKAETDFLANHSEQFQHQDLENPPTKKPAHRKRAASDSEAKHLIFASYFMRKGVMNRGPRGEKHRVLADKNNPS